MLWLFAAKIFFEQINFIVLTNTLLGSRNEVLGGLTVTIVGISVEFLQILGYITCLGVIVVLRPTYLNLF